jgi:putative transposase-like DNA-binding protein
MSRTDLRAANHWLTATATCTAFRAVEEVTGESVSLRLLVERVGWLAALTRQMTAAVVATHWDDMDLATVGSGVGPDGRALPVKGWMAIRRLGWAAVQPEGVYVSDRVRRVAEEGAARTLRLAVRRRAIVHAILETWPVDPGRRAADEWAALQERLPPGVSKAEIRNRTRQIRTFKTRNDGRLPICLVELEHLPATSEQILLAAADKQLVTIQRIGPDGAALRVQLPLNARPATRAQWAWHTIQFALPDHVSPCARLCIPTLRVTGGRVRVDVPWRIPVPTAARAGHLVAIGLDWGVNTLLTGTLGKLADTSTGTRVVTDGRMLRFDATGASAKLHRLRINRERVATRRERYVRLLDGPLAPDSGRQRALLQAKERALAAEHQRICDRLRHLDHALAWAAARWAVDQARALEATVIYVEDLATLEACGRRNGNARLSGQVRGMVVDAIRHLAAKAGLAVVTVPARGTSKHCPRCHAVLGHSPAPDRTGERGWKWALCRSCGLAGDRDHAASERIVARGLLAQDHVRTDRNTGHHTATMVVEGNVARARRPRRRSRAARRVARSALPGRFSNRRPPLGPSEVRLAPHHSRRVPERRAVPALATVLVASKRPAGPVPQTGPHLQARAGSGPERDCPPRLGRMKRPGAEWGFHRAVRATAVLPLGEYGPPSARPRPLGIPASLG